MAVPKASRSNLPRRQKHRRKRSVFENVLLKIHEIENWQHDNEFLLTGYRRVSNSYSSCISSLLYLHNQTGNVYSHLFGALLFLSWPVQTYNDLLKRYSTSDLNDILAFSVFFAGAFLCFGFSSIFHTFGSHSHDVYKKWLLFDLYGIFALIVGTVFSGTYYAFYCERTWWMIYSTGVSLIPLPLDSVSK